MLRKVTASKGIIDRTTSVVLHPKVKSALLHGYMNVGGQLDQGKTAASLFKDTCPRKMFRVRLPEKIFNSQLWESGEQTSLKYQIMKVALDWP